MQTMEENRTIPIESFSRFPGGRNRIGGPFSGEQFREDVLEPALAESQIVTLDLRAARVVIPSFMDEAFGPIIQRMGVGEFRRRVKIIVRPESDMQFNFEETLRLRASAR